MKEKAKEQMEPQRKSSGCAHMKDQGGLCIHVDVKEKQPCRGELLPGEEKEKGKSSAHRKLHYQNPAALDMPTIRHQIDEKINHSDSVNLMKIKPLTANIISRSHICFVFITNTRTWQWPENLPEMGNKTQDIKGRCEQ